MITEINKFKDRVELFKDLYNNKNYIDATKIVLAGWGTKEPPLNDTEKNAIDKFILKSSQTSQDEYNTVLKSTTGTFG